MNNNDKELLALSEAERIEIVKDVYKRYSTKSGDVLQSPLVHCSLITNCILNGELAGRTQRYRAMEILLKWLTDTTHYPTQYASNPNLTNELRALYSNHFEDKTYKQIANDLGYSDVSRLLRSAYERVSGILYRELSQPEGHQIRKMMLVEHIYKKECHRLEKALLGIIVAFQTYNLAPDLLRELLHSEGFKAFETKDYQHDLYNLKTKYLIQIQPENHGIADADTISIIDVDLVLYLRRKHPLLNAQKCYARAARYYEDHGNLLAAIDYYQKAGDGKRSTQLVSEKHLEIINQGYASTLDNILDRFLTIKQVDGNEALWGELKICAGIVAANLGNVAKARTCYETALHNSDVYIRTKTYYYYALLLLEQEDPDKALIHFDMAIEILEEQFPDDPLLAQALSDSSWCFHKEAKSTPLLDEARKRLEEAQRVQKIITGNREGEINIHNAWGEFHANEGKWDDAIRSHNKAMFLAKELGKYDEVLFVTLNLGIDYLEFGDYSKALDYLEEAETIANNRGNLEIIARSLGKKGECYYFLEQYDNALADCTHAYNLANEQEYYEVKLDAGISLVRMHAHRDDREQAKTYYTVCRSLCQDGSLFAQRLDDLAHQYLWLDDDALNYRQSKALEHVRNNERITKKEYVTLFADTPEAISTRHAPRELGEMVEKGYLEQMGKGRGIYYQLPDEADNA